LDMSWFGSLFLNFSQHFLQYFGGQFTKMSRWLFFRK
jgi:hypothetical protein